MFSELKRDKNRDGCSKIGLFESYFKDKFDGEFTISAIKKITKKDLMEYVLSDTIKGKPAPSTCQSRIHYIKMIYAYLIEQGLLNEQENISLLLKGKKAKTNKLPVILESHERAKYLKSILTEKKEYNKVMNFAITMLFLNTGLRISELLSININDFNGDQFRVIRKNDKERVITINSTVKKILDDYLKVRVKTSNTNALFITNHKGGSRISDTYIRKFVKKYTEVCGLDKSISPHVFRHTYATSLFEAGYREYEVMEMLDHENIETTKIYLHLANRHKEKIARTHVISI